MNQRTDTRALHTFRAPDFQLVAEDAFRQLAGGGHEGVQKLIDNAPIYGFRVDRTGYTLRLTSLSARSRFPECIILTLPGDNAHLGGVARSVYRSTWHTAYYMDALGAWELANTTEARYVDDAGEATTDRPIPKG